jgi:hypothetical protein
MAASLPDQRTVRAVALGADLRNKHQLARTWLLDKIDGPPSHWDARSALSAPRPVWTVASDTCASGRQSAPENVAFDHYWRGRLPAARNAEELQVVMSAGSEEVFACYRSDGLKRWTRAAVQAWLEDSDMRLRYAEATVEAEADDAPEGLAEYAAYLEGDEFREYIVELLDHLGRLSAADA